MPCFRSVLRKGPAGCGKVLVSAKHCCPRHCRAKRTKSPLCSRYRLVFAKLASLPRRSKCCCIARASFPAVPAGSFTSTLRRFVCVATSCCIQPYRIKLSQQIALHLDILLRRILLQPTSLLNAWLLQYQVGQQRFSSIQKQELHTAPQ